MFPREKGLNGSSVLLRSVLFLSTSPQGSRMLESELLLWLLVRLHVSLEQFSSPFLSNLCCRHMHGLYICSQHCHTFHQSAVSSYKLSDFLSESTNSLTFFPQHSGVHSFPPSPLGELTADQKEPEKTVCQHNNKGRMASHFLLHTFINSQGKQANEA